MVPPSAGDALLPVRELVGDASAQIMSCGVAELDYRSFLPGRRLWRVSGEANAGGHVQPFSLVAKDVAGSSMETIVYESGMLANLNGCIRAPRYVGRQPLPGGVRVWLEDIPDDQPGPWDHRRCVRVAGCIGGLTAELHRQAPPAGMRRVRAADDYDVDEWAVAIRAVERLIEDGRLARPWYSEETLHRIWSLLHQRDLLVAVSERLPEGVAHADCGRHNLHVRRSDDGWERYCLMDWESAVIGPPGLDLAAFVNGTLITGGLDPDGARDFDRAAEAEFGRVLVAAGGESIVEDAILGYRIHATLRWATHIHGAPALAGLSARESFVGHWNEPFERLLERRVKLTDLFLMRGESIAELT